MAKRSSGIIMDAVHHLLPTHQPKDSEADESSEDVSRNLYLAPPSFADKKRGQKGTQKRQNVTIKVNVEKGVQKVQN